MDETMEWDERISEDRYGCISVLFSNNNGLEMEEIDEIFNQFGEVLGIRRAGNERGIHFVTYGCYEDAKNAVDQLENHPDIQLKVYHKGKSYQRRKYFNDDYNNNKYRWANGYANDAKLAYRWHATNRQFKGYNGRKEYVEHEHATNRQFNDYNSREEYVENGREKKYINNWADDSNVDDAEWRESTTSRWEAIKNKESAREVDGASDNCAMNEYTENEKSSSWYNVQNYLASCNNTHNHHQLANSKTIATTINTEGEQFVTCQNPSEEDEAAEIAIKTADVEESVTSRESISTHEVVITKASEVIVGNVNMHLNEAFLLHLFNKFEPIAVSRLVPVMPNANVRYCSVYFKNSDDARKVERFFDKLYLAGRQLVVQRPSRLIATYLQQI